MSESLHASSCKTGLSRWFEQLNLSVVCQERKGRCVVSQREFAPGEVILRQPPFAFVVDEGQQRCHGCCGEIENAKRCSVCKVAKYCGRDCQKRSWKEHKLECEVLVQVRSGGHSLQPSLRLMLNILIKRTLQQEGEGSADRPWDDCSLLSQLAHHRGDLAEDRLLACAQMATLLSTVVPHRYFPSVEAVTELLAALSCNAHTICDPEVRSLGKGLYLAVALVNHSCAPNAVLLFDGPNAVLRATSHIPQGAEICINYIEVGKPAAFRKEELKSGYHFDCGCLRCVNDDIATVDFPAESLTTIDRPQGRIPDDLVMGGLRCGSPGGCLALSHTNSEGRCHVCNCSISEQQESAERVETLLQEIQAKRQQLGTGSNDGQAVLGMCRDAISLAKSCGDPSLGHLAMRAQDSMMRVCIDLGMWKEALEACRETLPGYELAYKSHTSPLLGLQKYTLGKLEFYEDNASAAFEAFSEALRILSVTHGHDHGIVANLRSQLAEAELATRSRH